MQYTMSQNNKRFLDEFRDGYIQTFDDEKKGRRNLVELFPFSELDAKQGLLKKLNNVGAGVYFTPNPCSGGRKEENVTEVRWIYIDLDDGGKVDQWKRLTSSPIVPHIIVESKNGYHAYWRCNMSKIEFKSLVERLIFYFNADPAISSINEVLRLPGFYHVKNRKDPFEIRVVYHSDNPEYHIDDMLEAYPAPIKQTQNKHVLGNDDLFVIKDISILQVLEKLGVEVKRNQIFEHGKGTSAMVNENGNYVTRFSGKEGGGSTIDAAMVYGNMGLKEAIEWLKEMAGIKQEKATPKSIAKLVLSNTLDSNDIPMGKAFTWGTEGLDCAISPIDEHHLVIVAGHTGMGKTTFLFDVLQKNAALGHKVLYLSLEQSREDILNRLARSGAGITKKEWQDRRIISMNKRERFSVRKRELQSIENLQLVAFPRGASPTTENIFAVIDEAKPDMVALDNFDNIAKDGSNEYLEQNRIVEELIQFAGSRKIPHLVLHHRHPSRDMTNVASLRGSGKISDTASTVLVCSREWDIDAASKDNARFTVSSVKERDWGEFPTVFVYWQDGTFKDDFNF